MPKKFVITMYLIGTKEVFGKYCDTLRECFKVARDYPVVCWNLDDSRHKSFYIEAYTQEEFRLVKAWTKLAKKRK